MSVMQTAISVNADDRMKENKFLVIDLFAGQGGFIAGFNRVSQWKHFLAVEMVEKHCNVLRNVYPNVPVLQEDVALVDWESKLDGATIECVIGDHLVSLLVRKII